MVRQTRSSGALVLYSVYKVGTMVVVTVFRWWRFQDRTGLRRSGMSADITLEQKREAVFFICLLANKPRYCGVAACEQASITAVSPFRTAFWGQITWN